MTKNEKIDYINHVILEKGDRKYSGPKYLYKYRPFDEYSFDMLENDYLYLCQVEILDDPSECATIIDHRKIMEIDSNNLKRECAKYIMQMLKPHMSDECFEEAEYMIYSGMRPDGTVRAKDMLEISHDLQDMLKGDSDFDIPKFVNWIVNIPEFLDRPEVSERLGSFVSFASSAREIMGVCSFAESPENECMWKNYAGGHTGYCVKYDISNYVLNDTILPVIYDDKRQFDIVDRMLASFVGQMIMGISNGELKIDTSQYTRLFLTKNVEWGYQKEWRLMGKAFGKPKAPRIEAIYLGSDTNAQNYIRIRKFALARGIKIVENR